MAPTIHLVRHAQGYHNLKVENENMHDPDLTALGQQQCADLRAAFPHHADIKVLVASPMRRTLDTCIRSFGRDDLYPIIALDNLQEVSGMPSDTGTAVAKVKEEFGDKADLSRVREGWTDKGPGSIFQPVLDKLTVRGREGRKAIRELAGTVGDGHVVVVLHGAFMHFLTDDWMDLPEGTFTTWSNCEYRSYQFDDATGQDADAKLNETPGSWRRRQGERSPPTPVQQEEWRTIVHERLAPILNAKA